MTRKQFENLVNQAIKNLPQVFQDKLDNVDFIVEEWPSPQQLYSAKVHPRSLLFGLYQGTPKTRRTHGSIIPDKITIFAGPILRVSRTPEQVRAKVAQVVKHEIAHHFGLSESRIRSTGH